MSSRILYTPSEPRYQKRRRVNAVTRRQYYWGGGVLFVMALGITLTNLPAFHIREIRISGLTTLAEQEVRGTLAAALDGRLGLVLARKSFFVARPAMLSKFLYEEFPPIADVAIEKDFPHGLNVRVTERDLFGILCSSATSTTAGAPCVYLDAEGVSYREAPASTGSLLVKITTDLPPLPAGAQALDPGLLAEMRSLRDLLQSRFRMEVIGYQLRSTLPDEIRVQTNEGFELWFRRSPGHQRTFQVLETVLAKEIRDRRPQLEYVDLRFGNKVFYKFKPK